MTKTYKYLAHPFELDVLKIYKDAKYPEEKLGTVLSSLLESLVFNCSASAFLETIETIEAETPGVFIKNATDEKLAEIRLELPQLLFEICNFIGVEIDMVIQATLLIIAGRLSYERIV